MSYKYLLAALAFFLMMNPGLQAQDRDVSERSVSNSYKVDKGCYVEIINKYGDIEVSTWEKDSVRIDVVIRAISEKSSWRFEMLDYIGIDFAATRGFVIAETTWKEDASFWRKNSYNMTKELGSNRIEVNYVVHMPSTMPLEIENRFGNVFMGNHEGELEVEIHHGDFRARDLKNLRKLDMRYGKVKIRSIEKGEIELSSGSSLDLDEAGEVMITSSSSDLEIDKIDVLNISSRHDDISLNRPKTINGSFSLSNLRIHHLKTELNAECKFGTVRIQEIGEEVERIDIQGNKTDVIINVPKDFAGRFLLDVDGEENLSYPKDMYVVSKNIGDDKRLNVEGSMGTHAGVSISVNTTSGFIEIIE